MTQTENVALAFFQAWGRTSEALQTAIRRYFTPDTVWENVGMATTTGPDQAIALLNQFVKRGICTFDVEILHIAAAGNVVFAERIDRAIGPDGQRLGTPPVKAIGVMEIEGEKILAWRDYFDTVPFMTKS